PGVMAVAHPEVPASPSTLMALQPTVTGTSTPIGVRIPPSRPPPVVVPAVPPPPAVVVVAPAEVASPSTLTASPVTVTGALAPMGASRPPSAPLSPEVVPPAGAAEPEPEPFVVVAP